MRSAITRRAVLGSLFILCCCAPVFTAAAQQIRFRFDPPDDFPAYISTFKSMRTTDMGALGMRTVTSEGRAKSTVDKKPDGYSIIFAPLSFTMTENGQPVKNPILDFVQNISVTYELDADELKAFMGDLWEDLADMVGTEDLPGVSDSKIVGDGERIIDPTTMLIYSETGHRTWKTTVKIPGRGAVEMVMTDEREYGCEKIAP